MNCYLHNIFTMKLYSAIKKSLLTISIVFATQDNGEVPCMATAMGTELIQQLVCCQQLFHCPTIPST